ncbi:MAG: S53 family peptidase [Sciscionella sp.]
MSGRSRRGLAAIAVGVPALLLAAGIAAPNAVGATPHGTHQPSEHHFSAAARSFVGAHTVRRKVAALEAATPGLPRLAQAYHTPALWNAGITGAGTTVATLVSFGDADIVAVMREYDQANGLPPADISVISPSGAVPQCSDPGVDTATCQGWGGETDLDVAMIHTMAPAAKIVIAATPVAETQGFTGLPEMMHAMDYMTKHRIADVVSMSFGTTEENFPSLRSIKTLDPALRRASKAGVTLVASSGDDGATGGELYGGNDYPYRVASWPAADPNVTSLGGTVLHLDANNKRTAADSLWPRSGAGLSKVYARPAWQKGVRRATGSAMRSFPDITMEGIHGTSESAPLFGGVLALAVQAKHGRLGQINPVLYRKLGRHAARSGIVDVTSGNDNYAGVPGFSASTGFDIASGWGTINAAKFVPALVKAIK